MTKIETEYPKYIRIDRSLKKKYLESLAEKPVSFFSPSSNIGTQLYFYAVVIGSKLGIRTKSSDPEDLRLYIELSDVQKIVLRAIVLKENNYDLDVLLDGKKTLKIIEEYANGGLPILWEMATNKQNEELKNELCELLGMDK